MGKKILWLSLGLILLIVIGTAYNFLKTDLAYLRVEAESFEERLLAVGRLAGAQNIEIDAEVNGKIDKWHVQEGDLFQNNDILLELEQEKSEISLKADQLSYQAALNEYKEIDSYYLPLLQERLKENSLDLEVLAEEYENALFLKEEGAISQDDFRKITQNYEKAKIEFDEIELEIISYQKGIKRETAKIKADQAWQRYEASLNDLSKYKIEADKEGRVLEKFLQEGESVLVGQPLLTVSLGERKHVFLELDEKNVNKVFLGQTAYVFWNDRHEKISGKVVEIAPYIDQNKGTFELEILLSEEVKEAKDNMTVNVEIVVAAYDDHFKIPRPYLVQETEPYIWTYQDGALKKQAVVIVGESLSYYIVDNPGFVSLFMLLPDDAYQDGQKIGTIKEKTDDF